MIHFIYTLKEIRYKNLSKNNISKKWKLYVTFQWSKKQKYSRVTRI